MANFPKSIEVGTLLENICTSLGSASKILLDKSAVADVGSLAVKTAHVKVEFELTTTETSNGQTLVGLVGPPLFLFAGVGTAGFNNEFFKRDHATITLDVVAVGYVPDQKKEENKELDKVNVIEVDLEVYNPFLSIDPSIFSPEDSAAIENAKSSLDNILKNIKENIKNNKNINSPKLEEDKDEALALINKAAEYLKTGNIAHTIEAIKNVSEIVPKFVRIK